MYQREEGTTFTIEVWALQYGKMTWVETGYEGIATYAIACKHVDDYFAGQQVRIVEYTTTRKVVSEDVRQS